MNKKVCGTCTKCCEGSLKLIVHGKKVSDGNPCHLLNKNIGCSDYENRPSMPCKVYQCVWLKNQDIPDKFQPNKINFIIHRMWKKTNEYYTLLRAGDDFSINDIEDIFEWFKINNFNFFYFYGDKEYICGSEDFLKECYNDRKV